MSTKKKWAEKQAEFTWGIASLSLFAGLWELVWALGWANPLLLPPPHIFLSDIPGTLKFFDTSNQIGAIGAGGGVIALLTTIAWTTFRVMVGLFIGFVLGVASGALVRYFEPVRKLFMPLVSLLAPISPVAWLPVSIFLFGIGNVPAIFLVFITVYFAILLSTQNQIETVPVNYLHLARIMGASRWQTFSRVVLPAILPGLFMTLRLNLFAAWMVVLIAEAIGVGSGLGQIVSVARSTFNAKLVFFTMGVIGIAGFTFDYALRQIQHKVLWWVQTNNGGSSK
ncbi:ABC transporter permease [Pseudooceanicola sp.]|uniref:ABC transporter permease n=1 Tax=Pseudooceanicola sp. TaxID=1914328 RepID=UPI002632840D|nr:ABC transporter permease [Pseudooceanicola sp.]MDF1856064.1 ABC transporter permease [Pseudooceanicola sp.]